MNATECSNIIFRKAVPQRRKNRVVRFEVSTAVTMMIIIFWEMIIIKE
jgi:hypothetical protein